jgi:hypothetical protein
MNRDDRVLGCVIFGISVMAWGLFDFLGLPIPGGCMG